MSINIDALFQHLMEDPDIIPPEGEDKEDIAMAMATQRARQSDHNTKALSMASEDRTISKLLAFLKADPDNLTEEEKETETPEDKELREKKQSIADFGKHERNFKLYGGKIEAAAKRGKEFEWPKIKAGDIEGDERVGETSYAGKVQKKQWEDAYAFLTLHTPDMVDAHEQRIALGTAGGQDVEGGVDVVSEGEGGDIEAPATASQERVGPTIGADVSPEEKAKLAQEMDEIAATRAEGRAAKAAAREAENERLGNEQADEAEKVLATRQAVSEQVADHKAGKDDTDHPFHPSKFGEGAAKQGEYERIVAQHSPDFLEAAHDWYTRPMEDTGKSVEEGGDNLPGKGASKNPYFHHDGGNVNANINPSVVRGMANSYRDALEDQAKEAKRVEGAPIKVDTPLSAGATDAEKLKSWTGKATSDQDTYEADMDGLLDQFKNAYSEGRGRKKTLRTANPNAAKDLDGIRQAWKDLGLQDKLDNDDITKSEYYEGLDSFINEHRATHDKHYKDNKQHIGGTSHKIPKVPPTAKLPGEQTQAELIARIAELSGDTPGAEDAFLGTIAEKTAAIPEEPGTAKDKSEAVQALRDFTAEAIKQTDADIDYNPPTEEEINAEIARAAVASVRDGDQPKESLESVENLIGEESLGELITEQDLPDSQIPMSRTTKKILRDAGIDPDGEGLGHITSPNAAREHVNKHEAEVAQDESGETPPGATGLDEFGEQHLQAWLDSKVGERGTYREDKRNQVEAGLRRQLEDEPDLLDGGKSWGEIRQMAESNNFMPEIAAQPQPEAISEKEKQDAQTRLKFTRNQIREIRGASPSRLARQSTQDNLAALEAKAAGLEQTLEGTPAADIPETPAPSAVEQLTARQEAEKEPKPGQQSLGLDKPTVAERRAAQPIRSPEQARRDAAGVEDTPEIQPEGEQRSFENYKAEVYDTHKDIIDNLHDRVRVDGDDITPEEIGEYHNSLKEMEGMVDLHQGTWRGEGAKDLLEANKLLANQFRGHSTKEAALTRPTETEAAEEAPEPEAGEVTPTAPPEKKLTPKQQSNIKNAKARQETAQKELAEQQEIHDGHKKDEKEAEAKFKELRATPNVEDLSKAEQDKIISDMKAAKKAGLTARKGQTTAKGHMKRHENTIDKTNAAIEQAGGTPTETGGVTPDDAPSDEGAEQGQLLPDEEVPTAEEAPETAEETPGEALKVSREDFLDSWNDGKWRQKAFGIKNQHEKNHDIDTEMDQNDLLTKVGKTDHSFTDRDGNVVSQSDLSEARQYARGLNPAMAEIRNYLNDNPDATEVPEDMAERMFGKHGAFLPLKRGADGKMEDPQINPKLKELQEDFDDHVDNPEKFIAPAEVTPETPPETPTTEPEPESTEGAAAQEVDPAAEIGEIGADVAEPVVEPPTAPKPPRRRRKVADPEAAVELEAARNHLQEKGIDPDHESVAHIKTLDEAKEHVEGVLQSKKDFLIENKMSPDHLNSLSDEDIDKEFNKMHETKSRKSMADHQAGKLSKEEIFNIMAEDHGKEGDPAYLDTLRKKHRLDTPDELVKAHKASEQRKADNAFEHASNDANSSALKMDVLPDEGTDKLHAMDRARDIAKKLNDSNISVKEGGKPLLDRNSMSHLKDLMDDAMDKGDLQQDEIDGIADEADEMGEDYLNANHKASIDAENTKKRAHHEEFLDHAEGMSEEALQRKGHDLDHSKGHELHDYDINEDGTVGERNGASFHSRNEDGSVEHLDGSGRAESVHDATRGKDGEPMAANHPPKLLGLDEDGKADQKEHFELMKKAAAGKLAEGDFDRFKELEAKNPDLAGTSYKSDVLGIARSQINGENGTDVKNAMGINEKDHDEADESSCQAPVGEPHPGVDKGWNPATHRWNDKERLKELQGQLGPGEAMHMPLGLHHEAVDKDGNSLAHLDQDPDGNVRGSIVTKTGVFASDSPTGMKSGDDGHVTNGSVNGQLASHVEHGKKIDKETVHAMGMNRSDIHTGKGQSALGRAFKETPGAKMAKPVLGKLGRMLQRNKQIEKGKPNATGQDRQRARRGTDGSPIKSVLSRIGDYTKEGLKDVAEELPTVFGGGIARDTNRWKDKQVRQAADKVIKNESKAQEVTDRISRVLKKGDKSAVQKLTDSLDRVMAERV